MSESNLEKFNRLFDNSNFTVNEKTIKKKKRKKCKIVLKTQKETDSCKEHVLLMFDNKEIDIRYEV